MLGLRGLAQCRFKEMVSTSFDKLKLVDLKKDAAKKSLKFIKSPSQLNAALLFT